MAMPPGSPVHDGSAFQEGSPASGWPAGRSVVAADADPEAAVRSVVLGQLSRSARSRSQLETAVAARGLPDDVSRRVLDRFEQVGLVDDASFAQDWVQSRHKQRGMSRRAMAHELRERGVDAETVSGALDPIDDEAEHAAAAKLAGNKARTLSSLPREKQRRRLVALLARRGYSPELAFRVVQEVLQEDHDLEFEA
jgi:regulatory protein